MDPSALLAQRHLSLVTRQTDYELSRIEHTIEHKVLVDGRGEFEYVLGRLLASNAEPVPKTLDLIGHSTPDRSLLLLGDWAIDSTGSTVRAFFRELADYDVLPRLGVHAVRLLGCQTADTDHGRATLCVIADILGLEVIGTTQMVSSAHYDARGFQDDCKHILMSSNSVPSGSMTRPSGEPYRRVLDIDSLPSSPLIGCDRSWPIRVADLSTARKILQLVRRADGAQMPGLLASPTCEIALPAAHPRLYHHVQVLLAGEFVRVYPDGDGKPGIVFAVGDPSALRALIDGLPLRQRQLIE